MTDNLQPHNLLPELERDRAEHRLPAELDMAVRQARERQPESGAVMRCVLNAKRLGERSVPRTGIAFRLPERAQRMAVVGSLVAAAAVVYLLVTWNQHPAAPPSGPTVAMSQPQPRYSPITQVSLVTVGYRQIEADLNQAQAALEQASEAIALSGVRRDVQQTLEEFYHWSDLGE